MNYYHVSSKEYEKNHVIEKGSYGKAVRNKTLDAPSLHYELVFEDMRSFYPGRPSRLNCVFVFDDRTSAVKFRDKYRKGSFIYEVEPVENNPNYFAGDFGLITSPLKAFKNDEFSREMNKKLNDEIEKEINKLDLKDCSIENVLKKRSEISQKIVNEEMIRREKEGACKYWAGFKLNDSFTEIVMESDVRVIRKLDE